MSETEVLAQMLSNLGVIKVLLGAVLGLLAGHIIGGILFR
jgi:hypothetical protein